MENLNIIQAKFYLDNKNGELNAHVDIWFDKARFNKRIVRLEKTQKIHPIAFEVIKDDIMTFMQYFIYTEKDLDRSRQKKEGNFSDYFTTGPIAFFGGLLNQQRDVYLPPNLLYFKQKYISNSYPPNEVQNFIALKLPDYIEYDLENYQAQKAREEKNHKTWFDIPGC